MSQDRQQLLVHSLRRLTRRGASPNLRKMLGKTRPEDVAAALGELFHKEARKVFEMMLEEPERAAEVVAAYEPSGLEQLLRGLDIHLLVPVFDALAPDDAADVLQELSDDLKEQILDAIADEEQEELEELMRYPEDSAGGIMSPDFFALDKELTVAQAIVAIQKNQEAETVFYLYCVNEEGTLVGVLSVRQLLTNNPAAPLKEVMESDVIAVPVEMDQEEVAQIVARYDLLALPVTDEFNKLVGIITVDDIIDVLRDEATEDMMLMAGVGDEDMGFSDPVRAARTRLPWLLAAVVGGLGAALLIQGFEGELAEKAILAAFIPIVMGLGGNVGVQASTIVVRGIAMGQLDPTKFFVAIWHETRVAMAIATICASLVAVVTYLIGGFDPMLAGAIGTSLVTVMIFGALLGTSVPLMSERLGIDPAVATGPILTTSIDLVGVLMYLLIAKAWLGI